MRHILKLSSKYFEYMKNEIKIVEARLNDDKRKNIKFEDLIIFKNAPHFIEKIYAEVVNTIYKDSFKALFDKLEVSIYSNAIE